LLSRWHHHSDLKETLSFAAVGFGLADVFAAFEHVECVEALAELAGFAVAEEYRGA
jgi:hypothetical protein